MTQEQTAVSTKSAASLFVRLWRWLPLLGWMAAIFFFSHQPSESLPSFGLWDLLFKKSAHFVAYAIFAWLALRAMEGLQRPYFWAFLLTVLYAASDEFHQSFVPGRNPSLIDVFIDAVGGMTVLFLFRARRLRARRASHRP